MKLPDFAKVLIYILLLSISGRISFDLPIGNGIPITGQSYIILVFGYFLPWRKSMVAVSLFLILGALGLPVFADGSFGIAKLIGKTGGYLFGFLMASGFVSYFEYEKRSNLLLTFLNFLIATLIILAFGTIVLSLFLGFEKAFEHGFTPFVTGGIIKAFFALVTVFIIRKIITYTL